MTGLGQDGWPQAVFIEKDRWYSNSRPLLRQRIFHWLHADNDLCSVLLRGLALQSMNDRFHCSWPNWWAALLVVDLRVTQANIVRYGMTCSGKHGKSQGEWELCDNNKKKIGREREREREREADRERGEGNGDKQTDRKRVGRKKRGGGRYRSRARKIELEGWTKIKCPIKIEILLGSIAQPSSNRSEDHCVCVCVCVFFYM